MNITLILRCTTWQGDFTAVAEGFPFVPRIGDHIVHARIALVINNKNPRIHWEKYHSTFVLTSAETDSRTLTTEQIKESFLQCNWVIMHDTEVKKAYPHFF